MGSLILRSGEPRPVFAKYLASVKKEQITFDSVKITHECIFDVHPPKGVVQFHGPFKNYLKTPFVIFGILIHSKEYCRYKSDNRKHMIYALWNIERKRVFLYNPFAYHTTFTDSFQVSTVITRLKKALPNWLENQGHSEVKVFASKMTSTLMQKVKKGYRTHLQYEVPTRIWYPALVLSEIDWMLQFPDLPYSELTKKHEETFDFSMILKYQESFEKFYVQNILRKDPCADGYLLHPETSRCIDKAGKLALDIQNIRKIRLPKNFQFVEKQISSVRPSDAKTFLDRAINSKALLQYLTFQYPHLFMFGEEIRWRDGVLTFPKKFYAQWGKALQNPKILQIVCVIDLSYTGEHVSHANVLIYSKPTNELEIFEPNGKEIHPHFQPSALYQHLEQAMSKYHTRLLTPADYCPRKMAIFQSLESDEYSLWNTKGYCAVWTVWYIENRLSNPTFTTKMVVDYSLRRLLDSGSLREFIWNYDRWMRRHIAT